MRQSPYQVFLSFKNLDDNGNETRDSRIAESLYHFLSGKGLRVFFSPASLESMGVSAYKRTIDDALDAAQVLVAVGTSPEHLDSQWVRYEWDSFFNDIISGIKPAGRIFTYIKNMCVSDLPRSLRQTQTIVHGPGASEKLYQFIVNALDLGAESHPASRPAGTPLLDTDIREYCNTIQALHETLSLVGFTTRLRAPVRLEDVYAPLKAMADLRITGDSCFADAKDAQERLDEKKEGLEIDLAEAFLKAAALNRRGLVILGEPGAGKTTYLRRLLLWCLKSNSETLGLPVGMIPVYLPLRELRDLDQGIDALIQSQVGLPHINMPEGFGKRLLERGNLLLLFDGLDESPGCGPRIVQWIETAHQIHRTCWFVVTCRFAGYGPDVYMGQSFLEIHIRPLDAAGTDIFIRNWHRAAALGRHTDKEQANAAAEKESQELMSSLKNPAFRGSQLFAMARNPLLLTNLCLIHWDRGFLPDSRPRLYKESIDVLLQFWREAAGIDVSIPAETSRRVLQPAALWLHKKENRTQASFQELAPVIETALKDAGWGHVSASAFLESAHKESGLVTGWRSGAYGFMHLGFQEYLAAKEIQRTCSQDDQVLKDLAAQFGKSWWQEVILLLIGLEEEPAVFTPFMREVLKLPVFTQHQEFMEICLDYAAHPSIAPFIELIDQKPCRDKNLWDRQFAALRILERLDQAAVKRRYDCLTSHPFQAIRDWLDGQRVQATQTVICAEPSGYEMALILGGRFVMGSPETETGREEDEGPVCEVVLPGFYMGLRSVTNKEYARFLSDCPDVEPPKYWGDRRFNLPNQPVVGVSWRDANQYADWTGLQLPTEAQWEYACRAGSTAAFSTGDSDQDIDRAGWHYNNSDRRLHPVGRKAPNRFGLHDMHGNVWEWCRERYDKHKYAEQSSQDAEKMKSTSRRSVRGGSWRDLPRYCRSAYRNSFHQDSRLNYLGFRLMKSLT